MGLLGLFHAFTRMQGSNVRVVFTPKTYFENKKWWRDAWDDISNNNSNERLGEESQEAKRNFKQTMAALKRQGLVR